MRFRYRLGYYMVGFSIGIFLVAVIWSGKDVRCNYFPNARVLSNLRTKSFTYSDKAEQKIAEDWVDTVDISNTLKYGDVDFDRSNTPVDGGKLYVIEGKTTKNLPITLEVVNYDEKAVLKDIIKNK